MKKKRNPRNGKAEVKTDVSSLEQFAQKYSTAFSTLSELEIDLLTLIARELDEEEIAEELRISPAILGRRKQGLQEKLSIKSRADYIKFALAFGLISF